MLHRGLMRWWWNVQLVGQPCLQLVSHWVEMMLTRHQNPGNLQTGLQMLRWQQVEDGLCAAPLLLGLPHLLLQLLLVTMMSHQSQGSLLTAAQTLGPGRLAPVLWAGRMGLRQSPGSLLIGQQLGEGGPGQLEAVVGVGGQASLVVMMVAGLLQAALEACMHQARELTSAAAAADALPGHAKDIAMETQGTCSKGGADASQNSLHMPQVKFPWVQQ